MGYRVTIMRMTGHTYLCNGREKQVKEHATWYTSPSAAKRAMTNFLVKHPGLALPPNRVIVTGWNTDY